MYGIKSYKRILTSLIFFLLISINEAKYMINPNFATSDVLIIFLPKIISPLDVGRFCDVKYPKNIITQQEIIIILEFLL